MIEVWSFLVYASLAIIITSLLFSGFSQITLSYFDYEKFSAYECGFDPFEDTQTSFNVQFFLIAIFYIIFDIELVLLFPIILMGETITLFQHFLIYLFVAYLFISMLYEVSLGLFDF